MASADSFDLERFVAAQEGVYEIALDEIRSGRKKSHWIWFIFPQLVGLGHSATAQRYAIGSLDEACGYIRHPILGPRLVECARVVGESPADSVENIFGVLDAMKVHSSMTLFLYAAPDEAVFGRVLLKFFSGLEDEETKRLLGIPAPPSLAGKDQRMGRA